MALALTRFELTMTIWGESSSRRSKPIEILAVGVDDATKRTNAQTAAGNIVTDFQAVANVFVSAYRLSEIQEDTAVLPPNLGVAYKEALITCRVDAPGIKTHDLVIPAPADAIFDGNQSNTQSIDTSDLALIAYLDRFVNDGTELGAVSDGEQLLDPLNIVKTRIRTVKSGKDY